ncbi:hypothetical protein MIND_00408000 [Mycena indigotica]|uniref:HSF-type DNA-binding domain-containing protein n=1 Tax=Mycena indigotica TaxID=2126181 RepID=A0A8H6T3Q8_9AGAR|nr:uncharacterized protein MIND_00408000 [Mycena indigotica]KAF7310339.1 hypothetical protein MIND_00408000 [Mycena indigotica]
MSARDVQQKGKGSVGGAGAGAPKSTLAAGARPAKPAVSALSAAALTKSVPGTNARPSTSTSGSKRLTIRLPAHAFARTNPLVTPDKRLPPEAQKFLRCLHEMLTSQDAAVGWSKNGKELFLLDVENILPVFFGGTAKSWYRQMHAYNFHRRARPGSSVVVWSHADINSKSTLADFLKLRRRDTKAAGVLKEWGALKGREPVKKRRQRNNPNKPPDTAVVPRSLPKHALIKSDNFLVNLYAMADDPENAATLLWSPAGHIVVRDADRLPELLSRKLGTAQGWYPQFERHGFEMTPVRLDGKAVYAWRHPVLGPDYPRERLEDVMPFEAAVMAGKLVDSTGRMKAMVTGEMEVEEEEEESKPALPEEEEEMEALPPKSGMAEREAKAGSSDVEMAVDEPPPAFIEPMSSLPSPPPSPPPEAPPPEQCCVACAATSTFDWIDYRGKMYCLDCGLRVLALTWFGLVGQHGEEAVLA